MAAKVHKTLRFDESLVKRLEALGKEGEAFSLTVNRVLAVGCDTLENVARNVEVEHADMMAEHKAEHDENTRKVITLLETENARLMAEHEADRAAIAAKDEQLAQALAKSQELTEQAHVLTRLAHERKELPPYREGEQEGTEAEGGTDEAQSGGAAPEIVAQVVPERIGFWDWFKNYR